MLQRSVQPLYLVRQKAHLEDIGRHLVMIQEMHQMVRLHHHPPHSHADNIKQWKRVYSIPLCHFFFFCMICRICITKCRNIPSISITNSGILEDNIEGWPPILYLYIYRQTKYYSDTSLIYVNEDSNKKKVNCDVLYPYNILHAVE